MKTQIDFLQGLAVCSLLLVASFAYAADLKLPAKLPELSVTDKAQLGKLEDDIGLAPGAKVSAFEIKDHTGKSVSFKDLQKHGPLLVIFYRGGWCPYCNRQIHQLSKAWPEFKKRGVTPVLISVDKPNVAALASRTYEIPFPVLSDPDLVAHDIFKVTMELNAAMVAMYKMYGIDLEEWSGKGHNKFAVASAFIVNEEGLVDWSHSSMDYKTRPSVKQLLQAIDGR